MTDPILVVDDDESLLELIEQVLEMNGLKCHVAKNGQEAFERIEAHFYPLIVTDIRMPIMNGLELLRKVRAFQANQSQQSKVILITAYSTGEIEEELKKLGADGFMDKPFEIFELVTLIKSFILEDE